MYTGTFRLCGVWEPVFRFLNLPFPVPSIFLLPRRPNSLSTLELKQKLYLWSPVLYIKYVAKDRVHQFCKSHEAAIVNFMYVLKFKKFSFFWFSKVNQCYFHAYMKPPIFSSVFLNTFILSIQSNCINWQLPAYSMLIYWHFIPNNPFHAFSNTSLFIFDNQHF